MLWIKPYWPQAVMAQLFFSPQYFVSSRSTSVYTNWKCALMETNSVLHLLCFCWICRILYQKTACFQNASLQHQLTFSLHLLPITTACRNHRELECSPCSLTECACSGSHATGISSFRILHLHVLNMYVKMVFSQVLSVPEIYYSPPNSFISILIIDLTFSESCLDHDSFEYF